MTAPVGVVRSEGQFSLVALGFVLGGGHVLRIEGVRTRRPTALSVQIGANAHIDIDRKLGLETQLDRYPWRFMNHSCDPNTLIDGQDVIAVRTIRPGEEVTFNYNTTEFDMAVPFDCLCGSFFCAGVIRGYRHLSDEQRRRVDFLRASGV
jgi:hypothetical protein